MWCVDKFLNASHTVRCENNHVTGSLLASGFRTVAGDVLWAGARLLIWIYHVFILLQLPVGTGVVHYIYYDGSAAPPKLNCGYRVPGAVAPSPQQQRSSCSAGKTPRLLLAQGPVGHPVAP